MSCVIRWGPVVQSLIYTKYQIFFTLCSLFPLTSFQKLHLSFVAASQVLLKGIVMLELNGVVAIVFCLYK